jgi:hypothetical protein
MAQTRKNAIERERSGMAPDAAIVRYRESFVVTFWRVNIF